MFQAADAEAALGLLEQGRVDLLFTDLMLPDGSIDLNSYARLVLRSPAGAAVRDSERDGGSREGYDVGWVKGAVFAS